MPKAREVPATWFGLPPPRLGGRAPGAPRCRAAAAAAASLNTHKPPPSQLPPLQPPTSPCLSSLPQILNIRTFAVKFLSAAAAVGSGLPVGPEGPMIHMGAIVGAGLSQGHSTTLGIDSGLFRRFQVGRCAPTPAAALPADAHGGAAARPVQVQRALLAPPCNTKPSTPTQI